MAISFPFFCRASFVAPPRFVVLFLFLGLSAHSLQSQECGVEISPQLARQIQPIHEQYLQWKSAGGHHRAGIAISMVPVQLHIIRSTAGIGGVDPADLLEALERVNEIYYEAGLHFFPCAAINYIDNDAYTSLDMSEEAAMTATDYENNVINIYVADTVTSGAASLCGYAYFPGGPDVIVLATACALNGSTFEHEIGHYYFLFHTHETFYDPELVDGSNCLTAGDLICDTPADPTLAGANLSNGGCQYIGTATDGNGDLYVPDPSNIMSYSLKECRTHFSDDQIDEIQWCHSTYRAYLTPCGVVPISADFYHSATQACLAGFTVDFSDVSQGPVSTRTWDFGDGNNSTLPFPSHTYAAPGVYTVTLTVSDGISSEVATKTDLVKVGAVSVPYSEGFEGATLGFLSLAHSFRNDLSVGTDAAHTGLQGLIFEGAPDNVSPYFITPSNATAFVDGWNPLYRSRATLCVDGTNFTTLQLEFDYRQLHGFNDNYTNFQVLVNGTGVSGVYQPNGADGVWDHPVISLNPYAGTVFTITFEGSHKYDKDFNVSWGNATFVDNIQISGDMALPVQWLSFDAVQDQRDALLSWNTAEEGEESFFELMRSVDLDVWEEIAELPSKAVDQDLASYDFRDRLIHTLPGDWVYYQLRQRDASGRTSLSEVVELRIRRDHLPALSVFPNPISDGSLQIELARVAQGGQLEIRNSLGQSVFTRQIVPDRGLPSGTDSPGTYELEIPVAHLAPGAYHCIWTSGEGVLAQPFLRQ